MKIFLVCNKAHSSTTSEIKLLFFPGQVTAGVWMREVVMSWIPWSHAQQNFPNVSWVFFLNICLDLFLQILIFIGNSNIHEVRLASSHSKKSKKNYIFANSFNFIVCDFGLHVLRVDPLLLVALPETVAVPNADV